MKIQKRQPSKPYDTEFIIYCYLYNRNNGKRKEEHEEAGKEAKRHTGYKSSPFSLSFIAVR